ncbi:tetratricopeptide repeat protein [Roseospira visakhapatnamensis]|uniref:HemY protein n=1 Tax=Roseospira visakhapatnamensis TaxID=390880 RepID=A0A7W6RF45_9PROT|nr:tetratricopeptide repeat protein [Roseospira visakhapatnamensis]MBB4267162.1 HemY protein [Roseospira visakhapatnamensis]
MVRLFSLIGLAVILVAGGVWVANRQGTVTLDWLGWHLTANMFVAIVTLLIALVVLYWVVRGIIALGSVMSFGPGAAEGRLRAAVRGLAEAYNGLRNDNAGLARVEARRARHAFPRVGKTYPGALIEADGLARMGRASEARALYLALLSDRDAEPGALRGLLEMATREGNEAEMQEWLERALFKVDNPAWAARPAIELAKRTGRVMNVERALEVAERNGDVTAEEARAMRVTAFVAQSQAAADAGKSGDAIKLARKALAVDAGSAKAAGHAARLLAADGKTRKAEEIIEDAWRQAPDAALAVAWRELAGDQDAMARLNRVQTLAATNPHHAESRLAVAEAAIEAGLWGQARSQLEALTGGEAPSARACVLMADVETGEKNDAGAAATWMRRALEASGVVPAKAA